MPRNGDFIKIGKNPDVDFEAIDVIFEVEGKSQNIDGYYHGKVIKSPNGWMRSRGTGISHRFNEEYDEIVQSVEYTDYEIING